MSTPACQLASLEFQCTCPCIKTNPHSESIDAEVVFFLIAILARQCLVDTRIIRGCAILMDNNFLKSSSVCTKEVTFHVGNDEEIHSAGNSEKLNDVKQIKCYHETFGRR